METNDDLKNQIEKLTSGEDHVDLSKIMDFTQNLMLSLQKNADKAKEGPVTKIETETKAENSISTINEVGKVVSEDHLDSIVKLAKKWVNPTTISLLSKASNSSAVKQEHSADLTLLKLSIERLSDQLKETHHELIELREQVADLNRQNTELRSQLATMKRRRR
jgi:chromosome segregation ATPase